MSRQKAQKILVETSKTKYEEIYNTFQLATTIDSSSEIIFEGWLSKQATLNWNDRYFILRPWMLYYYTKKENDSGAVDYDLHLDEQNEDETINELKKDSITEAAHGIIPIYPNTIIQHSSEPKQRRQTFFNRPSSPIPTSTNPGKRSRSNSGKDTINLQTQSEKNIPLSSSPNTPSSSPPTTPNIKRKSAIFEEPIQQQYMKITTKDSSGSTKYYYFKHKDPDVLDSWIKILQTLVTKSRTRKKRELVIGSNFLLKKKKITTEKEAKS
jgi:hypothetical protein